MSRQLGCCLPKASFPLPTELPIVEGSHYDFESIIAQALSDPSYDAFRRSSYLHFKFPSPVKAMTRKCEVLSKTSLVSLPVKRTTRRLKVNPDIDLSLLVHLDDVGGDAEDNLTLEEFVKKNKADGMTLPQGSLEFCDVELILSDTRSSHVAFRGRLDAEHIPSMCHAFRVDNDTLLARLLCSGLVKEVPSNSSAVATFTGLDLDSDVGLDQSGLSTVVSPVICQGSSGFIHELRRQPLDLFLVMINVCGHDRVMEVFSLRDVILIEKFLKDNVPEPVVGFESCLSLFHHLNVSVHLGTNARMMFRSARVHLKQGEVVVALPGSACQGIDIGFNSVLTQCHINGYWSPFAMFLDQVSIYILDLFGY